MGQYRKKPVEIEAISWDDLVEHGTKEVGGKENLTDGMPWEFNYKGYAITHEDDDCYLIPTLEGTLYMTPEDMLITGIYGEIYLCKIDIFKKTYDPL